MAIGYSTRAGRIFKFVSGATEEETFHVVTVDGRESLSHPYRFELNLASKKEDVDFQAILENPAYLGFKQGVALHGSDKRGVQSLRIHGIISEIEECEQQDDWIVYRAVMVPRLWRLSQTVRSRIFMDKSVIEIIEKVLKDNGLDEEDYEFRTESREYGKREYVVQYEESDLAFISRLMEHEGIFYFFSHADNGEKVIISDAPGMYQLLPGDNEFKFSPVAAAEGSSTLDILGIDSISRITRQQKTVQKEVRVRDYNYRKPSLDLGVSEKVVEEGVGLHSFYGEPIPTMTDFAKSKKAFKKVKVMNKDAVPKGSERPDCKGHPPGMHNIKGVMDASCMGKCKNNKGSGKVKIGGDKWVCQTEPQKHNGTPMNMMGVHAKGSQSKVTIMP